MRKNILSFSKVFLIVVFFIVNGFWASTALATRNASVMISPNTASVGENLTYTYTITNTNDGSTTAGIGSVEIQLPPGFDAPSISISSTSSSRVWELVSSGTYVNGFDSSTGKIGIKASGVGDKLDVNEFVEIQVTITAPSTANSYEWTAYIWANLGFDGTPPFTIISSQPTVNVTAPLKTVGLTIRSGNTIILGTATAPLQVPLQPAGTISLNDSSGNSHSIDTDSVLSMLNDADLSDPSWNISDLQYFDSFSSFLLNCITSLAGNNCNNWQYAVDNLYPSVGMDKTILSGGENVYLYFGAQNRVVLNSSGNINTNDTLTVIAQKYDYQNNTWITRTGVTVGLTQPDPSNPFSPIEVKTSAVDINGQVIFSSTPAGSYNVGVKEDFYFPTEVLTVATPPPVQTGGGGGGYTPPTFNITNAIAYLKSVQNADGSFGGSDLYTDWVAIAFGALNVTDSSQSTLLTYLNSHNSISSLVTDNERRAMALLALGQNPYSFNSVNYINAITNSFDGVQFGDTNLVNDDIFALIPLKNSGYTENDEIIIKDIAFIISKQKPNGSWEESVDITAAAVQALKPFKSIAGISDALLRASNYLSNGQNIDGGWNSVSSTSWAMQAMSALGTLWTKVGRTPNDYLGEQQVGDGAIFPSSETLQNRIWATSYAIPAALGKPWNEILQRVSKPIPINIVENNNINNEKITDKIKTKEKRENKILNQNKPILVPKIETSKIVENFPTQDTLVASAIGGENQIPPKSLPKILSLSTLLLLIFLLW